MPRKLDKSIDEAVADLGRDIGEYIRQQRNTAKISLRQLAKLAGVSNPYLSQIERGLRKPSAEILQQIAKGLRISAEALYVEAGILEQREGGALADAIVTAPDLTERQKQVLLDVYESFRRENTGNKNTGDRNTGNQAAAGDQTTQPAVNQTEPDRSRSEE
ncbi:helix-turn-helix transcriptional regulator [Actinosynnema sp. NPDC050801]|uniref:helix-turn-helix domain-containing protein n=1 Tax=unclassified Actinosynnema TaxID=2637065 RepID=UPI0033DB7C10